jgi:hypothetical protein
MFCGRPYQETLWNQKGADSGDFLFARMAASYIVITAFGDLRYRKHW